MCFRYTLAIILAAVCSTLCSAQDLNSSWMYSSYFGGSRSDSISVSTRDSAGNVYVTGITGSVNFPTTSGVYEPTFPGPSGSNAIFVSKFSSNGGLVWSTFVGPGCLEFASPNGIAVDAGQNVYISGVFECSGYPTTVNLGTSGSVFVTKLDSAGSKLVYSTTMGGKSILGNSQLALDSNANLFVIGAGDYCCGTSTGIIGPLGGISDFWVAEINSAGTAIPWAVEMGGTDLDEVYGIAIDSANEVYLTGYSASSDFPTTSGALDQPGIGRAFITKFDPTKPPTSSLVYSALAGNPGNTPNDYLSGSAIAVDNAGDAYVASWTYNGGLFTSPNAFRAAAPTAPNAYVFELNPTGSAFINGTYIGGAGNDFLKAIALDNSGNAYLSGSTYSWDFPTTAYGTLSAGTGQLGVYVKLNSQFAAISSVEVGPSSSGAFGATPDNTGGLWVAGYTVNGFPTTPNAYQPTYQGGSDDGFLLHTNFDPLCATNTVEICTLAPDANNSDRIHFATQAADVEDAESITLALDGIPAYRMNAAQFDTWLPVAPGSHNAKVSFRAVNQPVQTAEQSFTVQPSSTCPVNPLAPSLTICQPLNAAVVKNPGTVIIQANDPNPPKQVSVYIDGKFVGYLQNHGGTYSHTGTVPPGVHSLYVRGTDSYNHTLQTTAVFRAR